MNGRDERPILRMVSPPLAPVDALISESSDGTDTMKVGTVRTLGYTSSGNDLEALSGRVSLVCSSYGPRRREVQDMARTRSAAC
jgi:hypothetical protein